MHDSSALKAVRASEWSARPGGVLPFRLIRPIALCSDLALIVGVSVLASTAYHLIFLSSFGSIAAFFGIGALTAANFAAVSAARGTYQPLALTNFRRQVRETTTAWLLAFFLLSLVAFSLKVSETYSRGATLAFFMTGWFAITVWRWVLGRLIARMMAEGRFAEQKIILIAEQGQLNGDSVFDELRHCGYRPARTFEIRTDAFDLADDSSVLFKLKTEILEISRTEAVGCVFLLMHWHNRRAIERLMDALRAVSVPVYLLPDHNVSDFLGRRIVNVGTAWTAELKRAPLTASEQAFKRAMDIVVAMLVFLMCAPLMALVAILIKIESRGPILFMQTRNGFNGRPFRICKFRTMRVLEDGPIVHQATRGDPRVTHLGRVLRRANIDELPQLLNVLAGDMSLVGPRPHAAAHNSEYERMIANYAYRYHMKPGLTGWAQVNGLRGETRTIDLMARRVEFDLWYINNWSLWLDLKILLKTLILGLQPTAY